MTTAEVITQLADALEAARVSGRLDGDTEVYVDFRLPLDEYEALEGVEHVDDDPPGPPIRGKTVYEASGPSHDIRITAVPED